MPRYLTLAASSTLPTLEIPLRRVEWLPGKWRCERKERHSRRHIRHAKGSVLQFPSLPSSLWPVSYGLRPNSSLIPASTLNLSRIPISTKSYPSIWTLLWPCLVMVCSFCTPYQTIDSLARRTPMSWKGVQKIEFRQKLGDKKSTRHFRAL